MGPRRTAMLLMLAASQACAQPVAPPVATLPTGAEPARRILLPPPIQWDNAMLSFRPALQQTASDFAILTGGIAFGMSPSRVNARLPEPYPNLSWDELQLANEYPGEVRYFGVPLDRAGALRTGLTGCPGAASYVVLLFNDKGLFRLSYRLTADKTCTDTGQAAQSIFARYVPIDQGLALTIRYRTIRTQVVDVTDPTAGYLTPIRWHQAVN
jgi:hypothetical protein